MKIVCFYRGVRCYRRRRGRRILFFFYSISLFKFSVFHIKIEIKNKKIKIQQTEQINYRVQVKNQHIYRKNARINTH